MITAAEMKKITPKTKAIITVAWDGILRYGRILALAKRHNLMVVDDCARSVLSSCKGKLVGTLADISVFSFESKTPKPAGKVE